MNDAFAQLVGPIFHHLIDFQHRLARGETPELDAERERLLALLDEAEQKSRSARELAGDFEMAKYALVYWIDEILINSPWAHAPDWREHILEWDFYQERLGGDQFYDKAREAEALASTNPLETFYLCVALGFRGRYGYSLPDLHKWAGRAYARIASGNKQPDRFLPDEARDSNGEPLKPLPGKAILLSVSILVSATALVTLVCFLVAVRLKGW